MSDPFSHLADEALLVRFATSRDAAALDELVRRRWGEAYSLAFRLVGERALAEDVAQQAFVALIRGAGRFQPGRAFGPWFRTVVMNTARNASESRRTRRQHEDRAAPSRKAPSGVDEALVARELQQRVTELPFELCSPLVLHYFEGCSLAEVATTLGCAKSTVQSRIERGLEQLRGALAGAGCLLAVPELEQRLSSVAAANATAEAPPAPTAGALVALAAARSSWTALPPAALKLALAAAVVAVAVVGLAVLARPHELPAPVARARPSVQAPPPAPAGEPSQELAAREATPPAEPVANDPAPPADPVVPAPAAAGEEASSPLQLRVTFQATSAIPSQAARTIVRGQVVDAVTNAPLAGALVRLALPAQDMRHVRAGPIPGVTVLEARSDAGGRFELAIPVDAKGSQASLDIMLPGYRSLAGSHMAGGSRETVEVEPGSTSEAAFELPRALFVAGRVVDELQRPVADVEVTATAQAARGYGYVTVTRTDAAGQFEVYDYDTRSGGDRGTLELRHPGFRVATVQDVYRLSDGERRAQTIVLHKGRYVSGHVLSSAGSAVAQVMVEARFDDYRLRRAVLTDEEGRFSLEGLPAEGECTLVIHAKALGEKWRRKLLLDTDHVFEVTLEPIRLRAEPQQVKLLGMTLVTVTDELRDAYDLREAGGVLVLDPGQDHRRLGIGPLEQGFRFWLVGEKKVTTVEELARTLLDEAGDRRSRVGVVFDFAQVEFSGTNTQHMKLTESDLEELRGFLERLPR